MANPTFKKIDNILSSVELSTRSVIGRLPDTMKGVFEPVLRPDFLQILTRNTRAPRIALYGSYNSGKSDLINLFLGKKGLSLNETSSIPTRLDYDRNNWNIEFIVMNSLEENTDNSAVEQAVNYIAEKKVDVLLGVLPKENPSFTQLDISFLLLLREAYLKQYNRELPIIFIIRTDSPGNLPLTWNLPRDFSAFLSYNYLPVCTKWNTDEERRERLEDAAFSIYRQLPDLAKTGFAASTDLPILKLNVTRNLIWTTALGAASSTFIPAPALDLSLARRLNTNLVELIARIGDKNEDKTKVANNFISYLRPYGILKTFTILNNQLAKITGPFGLPIYMTSAATLLSITLSVGEAANAYFIERNSVDFARDLYEAKDFELGDKFRKALIKGSKKPSEFYLAFKKISDEYNTTLDLASQPSVEEIKGDGRHIPIIEFA